MIKNQRKAYFFAFLAILCWSTVASAFKISLKYMGSSQLLTISSFTSLLIFLIFIFWGGKFGEFKKLNPRDYLNSALLGFLNPFLYYTILFKAYELLPAQQAQPINFLWPIILVLLSVPLLGQSLNLKAVLAVIISFFGVAVIASKGSMTGFTKSDPLGISYALISTVIWAFFWLMNVRDKKNENIKLFLNFCFGFSFSLLYMLIADGFVSPSLIGWLGAIFVGFFEMGISFFFWLKALQYTEHTAKVTNLIFLVPFLSLMVINYVLGEKIFISTIVGLVLIIVGIILQQREKST